MGRRYALFLLAPGAIWGSWCLFIKVGVRDLSPAALIEIRQAPGWKPLGSAVAVGLLGTALARILSYRTIRIYGSSRSVLVAYMLPAFALLSGAMFLGGPLTWQKLVGLATILGGVALGSGALRLPQRTPLVQTP